MLSVIGLTACSDAASDGTSAAKVDESQVIHVAGISGSDLVTTEVETTRATDAEKVDWLVPALQTGIDVTYYQPSDANTTRTAVLKLGNDKTSYSFNIKGSDPATAATWLGNGGHMFHGFHIPEALTTATADDAFANQSDETVYTNLSHYLCMPPNHQIMATVSKVKLPFRHRLARVIAFVLIDPVLNSSIKSIDFDNVKILKGVVDETPQWTQVRKLTPRSMGSFGSTDKDLKTINEDFLAFYNSSKDTYVYPTSDDWATVKANYEAGSRTYEQTNYGQVPVYDVIVRPTYSTSELVMYDEASGITDKESNKIDFVVELENGLTYTKSFTFDLDANYQTIVYLHIAREKVDYSTMGSELWQSQNGYDDNYGLDNTNNHRLSLAGGSWQRAYRIGSDNSHVTDGNEYSRQYISEAAWLDSLKLATVNGKHWGDYFVLDKDISINASTLPKNFVFAGHLDARGHTITLTTSTQTKETEGGDGSEETTATPRTWLFDGLNGTYDASEGQANCHSEGGVIVPEKGYRAEVMNLKIKGGTLFPTMTDEEKATKVTGNVSNCKEVTE